MRAQFFKHIYEGSMKMYALNLQGVVIRPSFGNALENY